MRDATDIDALTLRILGRYDIWPPNEPAAVLLHRFVGIELEGTAWSTTPPR